MDSPLSGRDSSLHLYPAGVAYFADPYDFRASNMAAFRAHLRMAGAVRGFSRPYTIRRAPWWRL